MKLDQDKLHQDMLNAIAESKRVIAELMQEDMMDEDGYPTEAALEIVKRWHWIDSKGWFEFIKSIWWYPDWGWSEGEEPHDYQPDELVYRYHISTGGWSGNESIIRAMQETEMMWHMNWVQSRRGGHYIFERKDFEDDE